MELGHFFVREKVVNKSLMSLMPSLSNLRFRTLRQTRCLIRLLYIHLKIEGKVLEYIVLQIISADVAVCQLYEVLDSQLDSCSMV